MLEDKVKAFLEDLNQPKGKVSASRLIASAAEIMALVEEAGDVEGSIFGLFDKEMRVGAFQVLMGITCQAIQQ